MNKKTIYLLIFITVILIGGVGAGIYFKESSFINSLTPSFLPGVILPAGEGNLTFQWTGGYDGAFRLEDSEYDFWVDIKPYVILDDYYAIFDYKKVVGIQQIHDELPNVNFAQYIINKDYDNISINKWGINFTNIPQDYADKIEKIAFVLDDSNNITWDDVTLNKKSKIVKLFDDIEIDYSDLLDEGFTVELHNKTTLLIGNVTGKTMLFLDPEIRKIEEEVLECLVKTSDNVLSKLPREQWTEEMFAEERRGNAKQGYIILCKEEGWNWARLERNVNRFSIIKIPKSEFNESWLEPEYNMSNLILDENNESTGEYEILTQRKYKFPLENFMNKDELSSLKSIVYNSNPTWKVDKIVADISDKIELTDYEENNHSELVLHGSSGTFEICVTNASGQCDYSSLATWETGEEADLTGTGPAIANITEGFVDTTEVTIAGWTTTADDYIKITTEGEARHSGVWDDDKYIFNFTVVGNGVYGITISEDYVDIDGIQMSISNNDFDDIYGILIPTGQIGAESNFRWSNLIIRGNNNIGAGDNVVGISIKDGSANVSIWNSMIYDIVNSEVICYGLRNENGIVNIYNSVFDSNYRNMRNTDTMSVYNTISFNGVSSTWSGTISGSNNADSGTDAEMPSSGAIYSLTSDNFTDYNNDNFNLKAGSVLIDAGTALTGFSDDIVGTSRPQGDAWDIGAFEYVVAGDSTSPKYSLNSTNSTLAGTSVIHNLYWTDETALAGYIFSFDNGTGTYSNDSFVAMIGTGNWSNVTKTINSTVGSTINWKIYANDSSDNWNVSLNYTYATTSADTCTYSSGNWVVDCSDNCSIISNVNIGENSLIISGTKGFFEVLANITMGELRKEIGCELRNIPNDGNELKIKTI